MATVPYCGGSTAESTIFNRFIAFVGGAAGVVGALVGFFEMMTKPTPIVLFGIEVASATLAGAAAGALGGATFVFVSAIDRLGKRKGLHPVCYAGVVNEVVESFASAGDALVPYLAQHDRVDVVVKPDYWPLVEAAPRETVHCAGDSKPSPLIRSYYYSSEVEGAAYGSMVGTVVGTGGGSPYPFTDPRDHLVPDGCRIVTDREPPDIR